LVKSVALPKFTVDTQTLNSYNRKKIIQKRITYESLTITFHDDSADIVRNFWFDYFNYYYRDSDHPEANYQSPHLYSDSRMSTAWGFSPRVADAPPYLNCIRVYSLHGGNFSEYVLVNPTIKSFRHGEHNHSPGEILNHEMIVEFETVLYYQGKITLDSVSGFAALHYDLYNGTVNLSGQISESRDNQRLLPTPEEFVDSARRNIFNNFKPDNLSTTTINPIPNTPTVPNANSPVGVPLPGVEPLQYTGMESAFIPTLPSSSLKPGNGIAQQDLQRGRNDVKDEQKYNDAATYTGMESAFIPTPPGTVAVTPKETYQPGQRLGRSAMDAIKRFLNKGVEANQLPQPDVWQSAFDQYYLQTAESKLSGISDNTSILGNQKPNITLNMAPRVGQNQGRISSPYSGLQTGFVPGVSSNKKTLRINSIKDKIRMSKETGDFLQTQLELRERQGEDQNSDSMLQLKSRLNMQRRIHSTLTKELNELTKSK